MDNLTEELKILERYSNRRIDPLYLLLLCSARFTLLPEICDIFGRDSAIKFLDIFAGQVIKIPKEADLLKSVRDITIFLRLSTNDSPTVRESLAEDFSINVNTVTDIFNKVKNIAKDVVKVKPNG